MSILASKLFRLRDAYLPLIGLMALNGCSLLWNAESVDTPPTERMRCDNALDDDEDGLSDCLDEDCAWDAACLTAHRPFEILSCGFLEKQDSEAFDVSSLTNLENRCRDVEASSSFGGNRSVCGPPKVGLEPGEGLGAFTEYELNQWNVVAESYCANPFARALFAQTCGGRNESVSSDCDAPVLACINPNCRSFALFLNGDQADGQSSGVISRDSDLWLENTDFFEIDTSIRRLYGPDITNPSDFARSGFGDNWGMYPCNSEGCSGSCKMDMRFEPRQTDAPGPRVTLSMVVEDDDALSIRYAVSAGLGDELFARDDRPRSGMCGSVSLVGAALSQGYPLRLSGPYYTHDGEGRMLPSVIISGQSPEGAWEGLCVVPWGDNVGTTPETEYQIRFTRQGVFDRGKLLLLGVNIKQRKRVTGSRTLCGPSDVAIFQGGRTVCGHATDTVDRVWSVARYFDDEARRLVIAKVSALDRYKAFEEIDGVLFEVVDEGVALPSIDDTILSLESTSTPESGSSFRLWSRGSDGLVSSRTLRLDTEESGARGSAVLVSVGSVSTQASVGNDLPSRLAQFPSTIFRTQSVQPGLTWVSFTDAEIVIAHSSNGIDNWRELSRSTDFYDWLKARTELVDQSIVDVVGLEVPSMQLNSGTQRMLLLLTTHNPATDVLTSHVLTLVRDTVQSRITYLFYHTEVAVEPVTLRVTVSGEDECDFDDCPRALDSGLIAMTLDEDNQLMIYASTTIDESFRPQDSLKPISGCSDESLTAATLPESRVWRRMMYRLK